MINLEHDGFSGIFLTPDATLGVGTQTMGTFLAHLRELTKPTTQADYLLVREWALVQWRLQCVQKMEQDWWEAYELAMDDSMGEESALTVEARDHLQVCQRAIAAFDRLTRLESRFKKREAQLLPLMEALLTGQTGSPAPDEQAGSNRVSERSPMGRQTAQNPAGSGQNVSGMSYPSAWGLQERSKTTMGVEARESG